MNLSLSSLGNAYAGGTGATATTNPYAQRRQDFESLDTALLSGDLGQAQSAFAQLSQDVQAAQGSGHARSPFAQLGQSDTKLGKDFAAVSDALSGGDITGAQKAFATLRQDLHAARHSGSSGGAGHVHGRHGHDGDGDDGAQSGQGSGSGQASYIVKITIDIATLQGLQNGTGGTTAAAAGGSPNGTDIPAGTGTTGAGTGAAGTGTATTGTTATDTTGTSAANAGTPATGGAAAGTPGTTTAGTGTTTPATTTPATGGSGQPAGGAASGTLFELDLSIMSYSNNNGTINFTSLSASFFSSSGSLVNTQA